MNENAAGGTNREAVVIKIEGDIATVIINNPQRRNALDLGAWRALNDCFGQLSANESLRAVVVRGAGERAFAAGGDIIEFQRERTSAAEGIAYGDVVASALTAIVECLHPTVAMIYGACTGGGLEVACACDMRISATSGRFGVPINKLGHAFAFPEAQLVQQLVGRPLVLEMLLEGRIMDAAEAERRGVVNRVVEDEALEQEVYACARRIADGAPLAARMSKQVTRRLLDPTPVSRQEHEAAYAPCDSDDYAEGLAAFAQKRNPVFRGS